MLEYRQVPPCSNMLIVNPSLGLLLIYFNTENVLFCTGEYDLSSDIFPININYENIIKNFLFFKIKFIILSMKISPLHDWALSMALSDSPTPCPQRSSYYRHCASCSKAETLSSVFCLHYFSLLNAVWTLLPLRHFRSMPYCMPL